MQRYLAVSLLFLCMVGQVAAQVMATVIVYRNKALYGKAAGCPVFIDDGKLVTLGNGRFYRLQLPVGEHKIRGRAKEITITLTLQPGKTYYFRAAQSARLKRQFFGKGWDHLQPIPPDLGEADVSMLRPAKENK